MTTTYTITLFPPLLPRTHRNHIPYDFVTWDQPFLRQRSKLALRHGVVAEAHAAGFNLDEDLAFLGRRERHVFDFEFGFDVRGCDGFAGLGEGHCVGFCCGSGCGTFCGGVWIWNGGLR